MPKFGGATGSIAAVQHRECGKGVAPQASSRGSSGYGGLGIKVPPAGFAERV